MRLLRNLISQRIGIQVRDQDVERLRGTIADRCKLLQLAGAAEYAEFLQTNSRDSKREWEQLAVLLTTCETYFFRGQAHTDLLKNELLPELIRANQKERSLRIWSAGCASGEEAYTIAILLDELLGERHGWKISLLATDINVEELTKARRGVYSDWSFRQVDPKIQQKYFRKRESDWELDRRIRNMVTFQPLNLLSDMYPNTIARDMNLIICRNVFIYFSSEDVAAIVAKFGATLHSNGYLLTGHGELRGQFPEPLVTRVFAGSVVLQRDDSLSKSERTTKPLVEVGGERRAARTNRRNAEPGNAEQCGAGRRCDRASRGRFPTRSPRDRLAKGQENGQRATRAVRGSTPWWRRDMRTWATTKKRPTGAKRRS